VADEYSSVEAASGTGSGGSTSRVATRQATHLADPLPHTTDGRRTDSCAEADRWPSSRRRALGAARAPLLVMCRRVRLSCPDAASTLEYSSATVRTLLQNARRKMERYDAAHERRPGGAGTGRGAAPGLRGARSEPRRIAAREDPGARRAVFFDSGGEFVAPLGTAFGSATVARMLTKFARATAASAFLSGC